MPEMDGYEVCKQLKANTRTAGIPVLFLSAAHEAMDKVKAFNCGAADYLTKPYHPSEILSRVGIYLLAQRLQDKVDKLREAQNDSRQKELEGLMDEFTRILNHDSKSPAEALSNCLNVLKSKIEQGRNGQSDLANKKKVLKSRLALPLGKDEKILLPFRVS